MGAALKIVSDNELIKAYMKAIGSKNIDRDFIELLKQELIKRNLIVKKASN